MCLRTKTPRGFCDREACGHCTAGRTGVGGRRLLQDPEARAVLPGRAQHTPRGCSFLFPTLTWSLLCSKHHLNLSSAGTPKNHNKTKNPVKMTAVIDVWMCGVL